ncbi:MAG TPA: response regulator [Caulobacterales bacterium]|nr:response regulator [Caulobacterales bacterium]
MGLLQGKRILLVEDEFLIAAMAEEMLTDLGAIPVGPAATLDQGLALAAEEMLDGAILDVNLGGARSEPIAAALKARGVPFVVATGYDARASNHPHELTLSKPYTIEALEARLSSALAGVASAD